MVVCPLCLCVERRTGPDGHDGQFLVLLKCNTSNDIYSGLVVMAVLAVS